MKRGIIEHTMQRSASLYSEMKQVAVALTKSGYSIKYTTATLVVDYAK
jgi:hypothetical protein